MKDFKKIFKSIFGLTVRISCSPDTLTIFDSDLHLLRTREMVLNGMQGVHQAFRDHDLIANIRLETYAGDRYFHLPPTESRGNTDSCG